MILIFAFADISEASKFEYLYRKYKNLLYYKAWEILRDPTEAEDVVSETFIRVYRNLHKIDDPDSPRTVAFLGTIARNVALTMVKKRSAGPVLVENGQENGVYDEPADPLDLEAEVMSKLSAEQLYLIVNRLDEKQRTIFILKYSHDLSHGEIAAQMGITENNVTVQLHRTRKKLAEMINEAAV
ncbi:MAG: sigma-70 family RNA polymerase sigma factor [Coriobacteriia bacterium]|nr:sigma-70 family RNA polymerase sigma factor [Coriobacteriia bacterium]MCL2750502.1 sigma-70 family RNA polymerase sigma factor [Coriobacteriia bacterium]